MRSNHLKSFVRDCIPPVIARTLSRIRQSSRGNNAPIQGRERDAAWYDESFRRFDHYHHHYTKSNYYAFWTVIGDRIKRARLQSIIDIGCGAGQMATFLRDIGVPRYLGIDFSAERIRRATRRPK